MSREIIEEFLKCEFTQEELMATADDMARAARDMNSAESEKKAVVAQIKAKIEKAAAEHQEHYTKFINKFEYRTVKCEKVIDHAKGTVTITRLDTGEIIKVRAMTASERQQELELYPSEPEIDRDPESEEIDAGFIDDGVPVDADTGAATEEICPDCGCTKSKPYSDDLNCCEQCGQFMVTNADNEPTPEEIERGVKEHGARLE